MVGKPGRVGWKGEWHSTQIPLLAIKEYALLPWDSPATAFPHHVSQGESLVFRVCGCSPRLLNGIDCFHKLMVISVEPSRMAANKNKIASVILFIDVIRLH